MNSNRLTKLVNAGWLLIERGVGLLIAFFVMTLVARHLGPATFGAYAYVFGVVMILVPISKYGLETVVMRELGRAPMERGEIIGSALTLQLVASLVAYALAVAFIAYFGGPPEVTLTLVLVAGLQILTSPADTFSQYFYARERMGWAVLPRVGVSIVVAAIAFEMVRREEPIESFVALRGLEFFGFGLAIVLSYALAGGHLGELRVSRARLVLFLKEGWPLALAAIGVAIYMRVDQVMLGQLSTQTELGHYSIAVRVAEIALIVPLAIRASLFSSIVRAHDRGDEELAEYAQLVYDAMLVASLVAMLFLAGAAWLLFVPVFGEVYAPGLPMVLVLLLAGPWISLGTARGAILVSRGWLWLVPVSTAVGAVINIGLNFLVLPVFGGLGAAWTTVISYWLVAHGIGFLIPRLRPESIAISRSLAVPYAVMRLAKHFSTP